MNTYPWNAISISIPQNIPGDAYWSVSKQHKFYEFIVPVPLFSSKRNQTFNCISSFDISMELALYYKWKRAFEKYEWQNKKVKLHGKHRLLNTFRILE